MTCNTIFFYFFSSFFGNWKYHIVLHFSLKDDLSQQREYHLFDITRNIIFFHVNFIFLENLEKKKVFRAVLGQSCKNNDKTKAILIAHSIY